MIQNNNFEGRQNRVPADPRANFYDANPLYIPNSAYVESTGFGRR